MEPVMATEKTAQFFDGYARDFDAIYGTKNSAFSTVINRLFRQSMKQRYLLTIEGCTPIAGRTVLDIGSGPGHYSLELARRGAGKVLGIDFADGMLELARAGAARDHLDSVTFERADFLKTTYPEPFDYVIVMGFMDYVRDARAMVERAMGVTKSKAFFSFPLAGGLLAAQRQLRYKARCDLFLYTESQVRGLFTGLDGVRIETRNLGRDLFVTALKA
jgi:2-polyprenyl-3-methyl-5-hydroxy-6-metoxy-1,4-benzoquinol methylase